MKKLIEEYEKIRKDYHSYLNFAYKFYNLSSANNVLLIRNQFPEATRVAGFGFWKKNNRTIKKGSKGIKIYAPIIKKEKDDKSKTKTETGETIKTTTEDDAIRFYQTSVFDVSQTIGEEPFVDPNSKLFTKKNLFDTLSLSVDADDEEIEERIEDMFSGVDIITLKSIIYCLSKICGINREWGVPQALIAHKSDELIGEIISKVQKYTKKVVDMIIDKKTYQELYGYTERSIKHKDLDLSDCHFNAI